MRQALLVVIATAAGLGACAPLPGNPYGYGYAPAPAPASYGYPDGAYAPGPVYAEPGYAPYPGPGAIIIGGERRYDGGDRYRQERPRDDGGYRGNQNFQRERDFRAQQGGQNGGARPGPGPVAVNRPAPPAAPPPQRPQGRPGVGSPDYNPANPGAHSDR